MEGVERGGEKRKTTKSELMVRVSPWATVLRSKEKKCKGVAKGLDDEEIEKEKRDD